MTPQEFFYKYAGYSYDPKTETPEEGRRRCAEFLAKAERWASDKGCSFHWEIDPDADSSSFDDDPDPRQLYECLMLDQDGKAIGSLSGIDFGRGRRTTRRPVPPRGSGRDRASSDGRSRCNVASALTHNCRGFHAMNEQSYKPKVFPRRRCELPTREYGETAANMVRHNVEFQNCCNLAGVQVTKRQARKFNQKRGSAYAASARKAAA